MVDYPRRSSGRDDVGGADLVAAMTCPFFDDTYTCGKPGGCTCVKETTVTTPDEQTLLPCPFCGNDGSGPIEDALQTCEVDMEGQWKAPMAYSVQCDKCTATMGYAETEDEAVEAWNTRAAMPETKALEALAELMDLNDNGGPFGGEIYQDRVNRAWDNARDVIRAARGGKA